MPLFSGCQSSKEAYSLLLPIPCYLNRLQNLSFCHLRFIENTINQIPCNEVVYFKSGISGGGFLTTGWICKEKERLVIKKISFLLGCIDLRSLRKRETFAAAACPVTWNVKNLLWFSYYFKSNSPSISYPPFLPHPSNINLTY